MPQPARAEGGSAPAEDGQLDESEVGLISRYLEAKMRRSEEGALTLTFNEWMLHRLQAWGRMLPWRAYLLAMRRHPNPNPNPSPNPSSVEHAGIASRITELSNQLQMTRQQQANTRWLGLGLGLEPQP